MLALARRRQRGRYAGENQQRSDQTPHGKALVQNSGAQQQRDRRREHTEEADGGCSPRLQQRKVDQKRDDAADKRRTCISGHRKGTYGIEPCRRPVVPAVQGQVESAKDRRVGTITGTSDNQALSATALLEHRAVSSWARERGEILGDAACRESCASLASE